jgi:hypothetical protein
MFIIRTAAAADQLCYCRRLLLRPVLLLHRRQLRLCRPATHRRIWPTRPVSNQVGKDDSANFASLFIFYQIIHQISLNLLNFHITAWAFPTLERTLLNYSFVPP